MELYMNVARLFKLFFQFHAEGASGGGGRWLHGGGYKEEESPGVSVHGPQPARSPQGYMDISSAHLTTILGYYLTFVDFDLRRQDEILSHFFELGLALRFQGSSFPESMNRPITGALTCSMSLFHANCLVV
eukprot:1145734-Pelagomonas_calceolata.AAC.5